VLKLELSMLCSPPSIRDLYVKTLPCDDKSPHMQKRRLS
jgi:hypothetical protein